MSGCPKGAKALAQAGYIYKNDSYCKAEECGALLHWYKTPTGQIMPIDSITMGPHWQSCAAPDQFRKKKKADPPPDLQLSMFETQTREPGED